MAPQTWHYGLVAKWWAEFDEGGREIDYFRRFIERDGNRPSTSPAGPAGCCSRTSAQGSTSTVSGDEERAATADDDFAVFVARKPLSVA